MTLAATSAFRIAVRSGAEKSGACRSSQFGAGDGGANGMPCGREVTASVKQIGTKRGWRNPSSWTITKSLVKNGSPVP